MQIQNAIIFKNKKLGIDWQFPVLFLSLFLNGLKYDFARMFINFRVEHENFQISGPWATVSFIFLSFLFWGFFLVVYLFYSLEKDYQIKTLLSRI